MTFCDVCNQYTQKRTNLIRDFKKSHKNPQLVQKIASIFEATGKQEIMACNKCASEMTQAAQGRRHINASPTPQSHSLQRSVIIPKISQWPQGTICNECKRAIAATRNLSLNSLAKNKEEYYMRQCDACLEACSRGARNCPKAKQVRDVLRKWSMARDLKKLQTRKY